MSLDLVRKEKANIQEELKMLKGFVCLPTGRANKELMGGRQLQSLRDRTKDATRNFKDFEGKLDAAETEEATGGV